MVGFCAFFAFLCAQYLLFMILAEVDVEQLFGRNKRTELGIEYALLYLLDSTCDGGVEIETALEYLVDTLIHPILVLVVAVGIVVAICLNVIEILLHAFPYLLESCALYR